MKILLTNDDSHRSPLLEPVINKLEELGELKIVLPSTEQSWKAKSLTRFGNLHLQEEEVFGRQVLTLSGTPADCANFGIYHLFSSKPDLLVSGINAGLNAGACFIFSSGTVGACFEANIAGVPGVAFSQMFESELMARYYAEGELSYADCHSKNIQAKLIMDAFFDLFFQSPETLKVPATWNVNFPISLEADARFKITQIANVVYGSCFNSVDEHFVHSLSGVEVKDLDKGDIVELKKGNVSISPIDILNFGKDSSKLESILDIDNLKVKRD